jgi:hypothetical protein
MKGHKPIDAGVEQKTERNHGGHLVDGVHTLSERECFRQEIKKRNTNHGSSRESEDEMELVFELQRKKPPQECGDYRKCTDEDDHMTILHGFRLHDKPSNFDSFVLYATLHRDFPNNYLEILMLRVLSYDAYQSGRKGEFDGFLGFTGDKDALTGILRKHLHGELLFQPIAVPTLREDAQQQLVAFVQAHELTVTLEEKTALVGGRAYAYCKLAVVNPTAVPAINFYDHMAQRATSSMRA